MKTKMTVESFKAKVLPLLQPGCKTAEELHTKATAFIGDTIELVDDAGNPVEIDDTEWKMAESTQPETKGIDISDAITKAVAAAIAPLQKEIKSRPRPGEIVVKDHPVLKRHGRIKNFSGANEQEKAEKAYDFGHWFMATRGRRKSWEICRNRGIELIKDMSDGDIETKGHAEGANTTGGYLVPEQFMNDMIDLRVEYGVFRKYAKVIQMTSDTSSRPRRTGGLTSYFVGEDTAGTESTKSWDRVTLVAKKQMVLSRWSNELSEDAVISIGDDLAGEINYAFATKEDQCGFTGDGTSTYGGINGINNRLLDINGVDEGGGLILGATSTFAGLILADFNRVVSILPTYARKNPKWFCSPLFNDQVLQRLAYAAGGVTAMEIVNGVPRPTFLGYEVVLTEVMPTSATASTVACLFGDLSQAADFGDRRSTTIATSDSALNAFEKDEIIIRGTERFDIVNHDLGSATAAGPIVGLVMHS